MSVTTVVATRDRWPDLQQTLPRHEGPVVLVDNGSRDDSAALVRRHFPQVEVIALERNRGAVARNIGVRAAATPYVAFADDDSWWAPGALDRATALLDAHPRLALVAARVLVGDQERLDPVCAQMARSPLPRPVDLPGPAVLGFVACGAVVRRSAFLDAGGFDPVVRFFGEEERLALDLAAEGWGLAYVDSVVAHHHPSSNRPASTSRRALGVRNELLTAVMRRPWPVVIDLIRRSARRGRPGLLGLARAVPRLPRALLARRPIPRDLEAQRQLLS